MDGDGVLVDRQLGHRVDVLAEQRAGSLVLMALANPVGQQAVQAGGHHGQLQVDVDFQRDRGREGIDVEEVDGLGDGVLDQHAAGIAADQPGGGFRVLVGDEQGRLVMA